MEYLVFDPLSTMPCRYCGDRFSNCWCGGYCSEKACSHCDDFEPCGSRAPVCGADTPECPGYITDLSL